MVHVTRHDRHRGQLCLLLSGIRGTMGGETNRAGVAARTDPETWGDRLMFVYGCQQAAYTRHWGSHGQLCRMLRRAPTSVLTPQRALTLPLFFRREKCGQLREFRMESESPTRPPKRLDLHVETCVRVLSVHDARIHRTVCVASRLPTFPEP